jgi:archaellum component FlaC
MTDDLSDPQQWRDNIEARVGTLEATVTTEAQLRATMDFDMGKMQSEFRAQRSMLQALHVTQQDHNRRLTGVEGRLTGVEDRLTGVEGRLTGVEDRLTGVEGRLTGVEGRLTNIEGGLELVRVGVEALHGKLDLLIDKN